MLDGNSSGSQSSGNRQPLKTGLELSPSSIFFALPLGSVFSFFGGGGERGIAFAIASASPCLFDFLDLPLQLASAARIFLALFSSTNLRSLLKRFCSQPVSVRVQNAMTAGLSLAHLPALMPSMVAIRLSSAGNSQLDVRHAQRRSLK